MAEPTVTGVVAVTLTPRLAESDATGCATSAVAAAWTEEDVTAEEGAASGMVRMAAMEMLPAATRSVR